MPHNLFKTFQDFDLGNNKKGKFYSLPMLEKQGVGPISKLPISIRIVLESVLRNCDGKKVREEDIRAVANWQPSGDRTAEIPFVVARVVLQDFTGVPCCWWIWPPCAPTAARNGQESRGLMEPLVPVDLVVDHSRADRCTTGVGRRPHPEYGDRVPRATAPAIEFLKWGKQAFDTASAVVPPGIGIVHQVNLEYLALKACCKKTAYIIPIRWWARIQPHHHDQRLGRGRMGRRRHRGRGGNAGTAGVFPDARTWSA